jgi:peroxiredoxin
MRSTASPLAAPAVPVLANGAAAPSFENLLGTDGRRYRLASFAASDLVVLVFSSNRCPTARAYADRMNALQEDEGAHGLQLVAINSNDPHLYPDESYPRMVERAAEDGYAFPYLVDTGQHVARAFGAACTFHVFLLDRERRVRYEGRFDDSRLPERVTTHDLRDAIEDLRAGREVRVPTTRPFGCSLDLV